MAIALAAVAAPAASPVAYSRRTVSGVHLHVVEVDLNDPRVVVSPAIAAGGIGRSEEFPSFVRRLQPVAAINGTFFGTRSLLPVADIVADGKLKHFGGIGTALAFSPEGVDFIRLPKSRRVDWSEHEAALAGGPLLVWEGFARPHPGGEGFGDPRVFSSAAPRTAVGITRTNRLLLVTTARGTSLGKLAAAMRAMGAVYSFNLDGGASAGMWVRGQMIQRPKRPLTNVLCVYLSPEPVREVALRPPAGLDWRQGHPPRPTATLTAGDLRITVKLPRRWTGRESLLLRSEHSLPEGWAVWVRLDGEPVALKGALPADVALDLTSLRGPKHVLWVGLVDGEGNTVGRMDRIFRPGTPGSQAW